MNVTKILDYNNIVEENLPEELDGKIIMDFAVFNKHRAKGIVEFENWKIDFTHKDIPFIVTRDIRPRENAKDEVWYTLWKEQIAFTPYQAKQERFEIFDFNAMLIED